MDPRPGPDAPAAVLLVDVATNEVVHANPAARLLVDSRLPVAAPDWAPGAADLLTRAARGETVPGEHVGIGGRWFWATAVPVPARDDRHDQSLVVLVEAEGDDPQVRHRAVGAAGLSFTIADPRQDDCPLVYVNAAFERTTGYSADEVIGRNCRFLQGADTDPVVVAAVRAAIEDEQPAVLTLLNQRKDGTAFWNELSLSPVYDGTGTLTHFVGIQSDVTARVLGEQEVSRHLKAEQAARAVAEDAQRRLGLLAEATSRLAATLDVEESLNRLADLAVPALADFCTIDLLQDDDGRVRRLVSRHVDPDQEQLLKVVEERQPTSLTARSATSSVLAGGPPVLLGAIDEAYLDVAVEDPELRRAYVELGIRSCMVLPLRARRQVLGALALFSTQEGRAYTEADLETAGDLARRAALTVDNARLYEREHQAAEALQRSLLPALPRVPGLERAARYLPSHTANQIGGDWYDLLPLPDGTVGIAVGDVMGHDMNAAAAMGQLRSVLRSYAWQGGTPAQVLDHLDELVQGLDMAQLATAVYGRLDLRDGLLRYANAGHLPPAVRFPDQRVALLEGGRSVLVGAAIGPTRTEDVVHLPSGSVLVLYTDGLVEDRERDIDDGFATLLDALAAAPEDVEGICDALLDALATAERADDVALLVVKVS